MFYVVHFSEENTFDVRDESQVIYDGQSPIVGQKVEAAYKTRGKTMLYEASVVYKSDSLDEAEEYLSKELEKENLEEGKGSEPGLGRGKREKKRKSLVLEERSEEDKKKKDTSSKDLKKKELVKLAKEMKRFKPNETSEMDELIKENLKLKKKVKELEKERQVAIDLENWLIKVQKIADSLGSTERFSQATELPVLSNHSVDLSPQPDSAINGSDSKPQVRPGPSMPHSPSLSTYPESIEDAIKVPGSDVESQLEVGLPEMKEDEFSGSMEGLLHKGPSAEVVELIQNTKVYVARMAIHSIKISAKTHSNIARALLTAVFEKESIMNCTLTGKMSATGRKSLNQIGVNAIFEASTAMAKEMGLAVEDRRSLIKSMGTRISEIRNKSKSNK